MRKITWILPTVCIVLAVIFSFGSILLFSPALINSNSSKEYDLQTINGTEKTTVWTQDERAHNLLWWQAQHASRPYRFLCLQYLLDAYYAPLSDWSYKHPETGNEVYRLALPLYEEETEDFLYSGGTTWSSDWRNTLGSGGFRKYNSLDSDYGDIHLQFAVYQYLHLDKELGKQTYLEFADSTDDHYFCDRFLKFVTTAEKSAPEDIAWAKSEALRAETLLLAEYEADKARAQAVLEARTAQIEDGTYTDISISDWYADSHSIYTVYSEQQIEMKCQTLRAIAEPS